MKLRTKLVGGTMLLVVLLGVSLILLLRGSLAARLETELHERGVSIAKFVAGDSVKLIVTEDIIRLLLLVEASRRVEADIAYIFVLDAGGAVMAHTFGDSFPSDLLRANAPAPDGGHRVRKLATGMGTIYDIAVGVGENAQGLQLGSVRVGLLGTSIDRSVAAVLYRGAAITVACLMLFGAVALWADLALMRNVEALSEGTAALGLGDLDYRIPVRGRGEFAELAAAFNSMADSLRRSEDRLVDLNTALLREIQTRTGAEQDLRRSLERYGVLFKSVSDAIYVHELTGDGRYGSIVEANDVGCARLGYAHDELMGRSFEEVVAPDADVTAGAAVAAVAAVAARLRTGATVVFEQVHRARGGRRIPVEVSSRIFDLDGRPAVLAICRDITERKLAEEELRDANAELERQNVELKKLDRLREGFVRDVSHELKTPVAKHSMQLEILRGIAARAGFAPAIAKVVAVMESSIRRQQQVIRNLLGLSRLESGVRVYRRDPVQLDQVLVGVVEDYEPELRARDIDLAVDLHPVRVSSDGEMLWHVFSNLVNNAIKFQKCPSGGQIRVTLRLEGAAAVVRVADQGIGLSAEERARVFDKFYQVTASAEGSGVGLTICRMIVEGVGGTIRFESAGKGHGATAVVTIPLEGGATNA